jgi:LmbE family N-acetylglucosaminyl deacetylase
MILKDFPGYFRDTIVIAISPHPDDSVLGAGGLIHRLTDTIAWTNAGIDAGSFPVVYTICMTAGTRGVDDEYLLRFALGRMKEKEPDLATYLLAKSGGGPIDKELERRLTVIREEIRHQESSAEGRLLRVKETRFLNLRDLYHNHTISANDRTIMNETITSLYAEHPERRRIILLPHRDDMHPVHGLSTSVVIDIVENEVGWENTLLWQYESPWITFTPHQVEVVIPFDGIAMATKAEAMAVHRSQEYRTNYSDVARYGAQMRAETYPELLGGFGTSGHSWDYVEAFQELRPVNVFEMPNASVEGLV